MNQTDITYETPAQPRQLRLDTETRCNATCLSCHRFLSNRKGEMSFELIGEILDDVSRWPEPLTEIIPVNYGEFFMRPDWLAILKVIAHKLPKTQIVIPTNGLLLDDAKIDALCTIPTVKLINFSINAFFEETYEAFMGCKADFERLEQSMKLIKVMRPDITLWASMVSDPEFSTDLERDKFIQRWNPFAHPQILPAASAGRGKQIWNAVELPCRSIFSDMVIGFDRKISSCCFDAGFTLDLGYYDGDLLRNWWSKEMVSFREVHNEHRREEIALCKNCTFA